jgi:hypothetical protein
VDSQKFENADLAVLRATSLKLKAKLLNISE